ncbi:unnamed protein product [Amoebophrya sp. A120]|nr:unnamed protein product [Amoebophrya sp. A120]|eukprot:GSA120T00019001001.1
MDWQADELLSLADRSLASSQIEFGMNIKICDMILANPDLSIQLLPRLAGALSTSATSSSAASSSGVGGPASSSSSVVFPSRTSRPSPDPLFAPATSGWKSLMNVGRSTQVRRTSVALSLLEMLLKNCGMAFVRYLDAGFCDVWERLIRRKQSVGYRVARNANHLWSSGSAAAAKLFGGSTAASSSSYNPNNPTSNLSASRGSQSEQAQALQSTKLGKVGVTDETSQAWDEIVRKALELLQLVATTLIMHEHENPLPFVLYRKLRSSTSVTFPKPRTTDGIGVRDALVEEERAVAGGPAENTSSPSNTAARVIAESSWSTSQLQRHKQLTQTPLVPAELQELDHFVTELEESVSMSGAKNIKSARTNEVGLQDKQDNNSESEDSGGAMRDEDKQATFVDLAEEIFGEKSSKELQERKMQSEDSDLAHFLRQVRPRLCVSIQVQADQESSTSGGSEAVLVLLMNLLSRLDEILDNRFFPRPPPEEPHPFCVVCGCELESGRVCTRCGGNSPQRRRGGQNSNSRSAQQRPSTQDSENAANATRSSCLLISDERNLGAEALGSSPIDGPSTRATPALSSFPQGGSRGPLPAPGNKLHKDWRFVDGGKQGRGYWFNRKTARSQWQPPAWVNRLNNFRPLHEQQLLQDQSDEEDDEAEKYYDSSGRGVDRKEREDLL